jgi:hypothetical protein
MKRKPVTIENIAESQQLRDLWDKKKILTQTEFGKQFDVGNQSYVNQCLTGRVALTLKVGMAFARHLNCHLAEFSPRLDDELAALVDFATDQRALLHANKLFSVRCA